MAVVFIEQKNRQKFLIMAFIGVLAVIAFVVWLGFFKKDAETSQGEIIEETFFYPREEVKINFDVLKNTKLQNLQPFLDIKPLEGAVGRENPFVPYYK